jgi:Na+-transporting methylmalonyl-CoA/oxaloacetate decarboxylase gamma subunit
MESPIGDALVYSLIAFSIVFIVLGGLTLVIFAMRLLTGSAAPKEQPAVPTAKAAPMVNLAPTASLAPATGANTNRHVAAITAAILTATQGRGRVLRIIPAGRPGVFAAGTSSTWRATAVADSVNRGVEPSWKR